MKIIRSSIFVLTISIISLIGFGSCDIGCGGGTITFTNTTQHTLSLHVGGMPFGTLYPNGSLDYLTLPDQTVNYEVYYSTGQLAASNSRTVADCGHTYVSF